MAEIAFFLILYLQVGKRALCGELAVNVLWIAAKWLGILSRRSFFVSVVRERGLGWKMERNMKGWDERDWRNERRRRRSCFFVFVLPLSLSAAFKKEETKNRIWKSAIFN